MQVIRQPKPTTSASSAPAPARMAAQDLLCDAGADVVMLEAAHGGLREGLEDVGVAVASRCAAAPRRLTSRSASSTAASAAGTSRANRTGGRLPASTGFAERQRRRAYNDWGASRCAWARTTSGRRSLDGLGDDWPITYDDVKPYHDKLDCLVGIFGSMVNPPNEPDGVFQPPPKPRRLRAADQAGGGRAEDHRHSQPPLDSHATAERTARATTADSAAAAARRTRTSRCCRRRCGRRDRQAAHHHERDGARGLDRRDGLATACRM